MLEHPDTAKLKAALTERGYKMRFRRQLDPELHLEVWGLHDWSYVLLDFGPQAGYRLYSDLQLSQEEILEELEATGHLP